jgi:hypothetical protein
VKRPLSPEALTALKSSADAYREKAARYAQRLRRIDEGGTKESLKAAAQASR